MSGMKRWFQFCTILGVDFTIGTFLETVFAENSVLVVIFGYCDERSIGLVDPKLFWRKTL